VDEEITHPPDADYYQLAAHARHAAFEVRDADRGYTPTPISRCCACFGVFLAADVCPFCQSDKVDDETSYETEEGASIASS
jgi:hypothetical protein